MRLSKNPSPARSVGTPRTGLRSSTSRGSRSEGNGAQCRNSLLDLDVSPLQPQTSIDKGSLLNDNSDVASTRPSGWWKMLGEPSIDMGAIFSNKMSGEIPFIEEAEPSQVPVKSGMHPATEEPETSSNMTINSIVLPDKRLFTKKTKQPAAKFTEVQSRESAESDQKTHSDKTMIDTIYKPTKNLFSKRPIAKRHFLSFSNITAKSMNRTNFVLEPENNKKPIFGNKKKRNFNPFEGFVASDSENETIHAKVFAFQRNRPDIEAVRRQSRRSSVANSEVSSASEFDFETTKNWKQLPSSTMMEIDPSSAKNTPKKPRLTYDIAEEAGKDYMPQCDTDDDNDLFVSSKSPTKKSNASKEQEFVTVANKSATTNIAMNEEEIKQIELHEDVVIQVNLDQVEDGLHLSTKNLTEISNSSKEPDYVSPLRKSATKKCSENYYISKDTMNKIEANGNFSSQVDHDQIEIDYLSVDPVHSNKILYANNGLNSSKSLSNKSANKEISQNRSICNEYAMKQTEVQEDAMCRVVKANSDDIINESQTGEVSPNHCRHDKSTELKEIRPNTLDNKLHQANDENINSESASKKSLNNSASHNIMKQMKEVVTSQSNLNLEKADINNKLLSEEFPHDNCSRRDELSQIKEILNMSYQNINNQKSIHITRKDFQTNKERIEQTKDKTEKTKDNTEQTEQVEETGTNANHGNRNHENCVTNVEHFEFQSKIICPVSQNLDDRFLVGSYHITNQSKNDTIEKIATHEDIIGPVEIEIGHDLENDNLYLKTNSTNRPVDSKPDSLRSLPNKSTTKEISQYHSMCNDSMKQTRVQADAIGQIDCDQANSDDIILNCHTGEVPRNHGMCNRSTEVKTVAPSTKDITVDQEKSHFNCITKDKSEQLVAVETSTSHVNIDHDNAATDVEHYETFHSKIIRNAPKNSNDRSSVGSFHISDQSSKSSEWNSHDTQWKIRKSIRRMTRKSTLRSSLRTLVMAKSVDVPETVTLSEITHQAITYSKEETEGTKNAVAIEDIEKITQTMSENLQERQEIELNNGLSKITQGYDCENQENVNHTEREQSVNEKKPSETQAGEQETEIRESTLMHEQEDFENDDDETGREVGQNNDLSKNTDHGESVKEDNLNHTEREQDKDERETQESDQEIEMRDCNLVNQHEDAANGISREIVQIKEFSETHYNECEPEQGEDENETNVTQEGEKETEMRDSMGYEQEESENDENEISKDIEQDNDLSKITDHGESINEENVNHSELEQDEDEMETSERQESDQEAEMRDSNLEYGHEDTEIDENYSDREQDEDEYDKSERQETEIRDSNLVYEQEERENANNETSREITSDIGYQENKGNRFFARGSEHNNDSSHFFGGESTVNTAVETSTRPNKAKKQMPLEAYLKKLKDENLKREQKMRKELETFKPAQPDLNYHYVVDNFNKINRPSKPRAAPKMTLSGNHGRYLGDRATVGGNRATCSSNQPNAARRRATTLGNGGVTAGNRDTAAGHQATANDSRAAAGENRRPADDNAILEGRYKPAKLFMPKSAPWVTKRLYKFLESKLEPRYGVMALARAEKLVRVLAALCRELRRPAVDTAALTHAMARELARLRVVRTHLDYYAFVEKYLSLDLVYMILPDVFNKLPLPPGGVYADILPQAQSHAAAD